MADMPHDFLESLKSEKKNLLIQRNQAVVKECQVVVGLCIFHFSCSVVKASLRLWSSRPCEKKTRLLKAASQHGRPYTVDMIEAIIVAVYTRKGADGSEDLCFSLPVPSITQEVIGLGAAVGKSAPAG